MADRARHAFGSLVDVEKALNEGKIDSFDILFLDGDTEPKVGWIDKKGEFKLVKNETDLSGVEAAIETKADAADVELLEGQIATKVDATEVDAKIDEATASTMTAANAYTDERLEAALGEYLAKRYEISHKPDGTLVNYRDKEIRIMVPVNTQFALQNSGEGADANAYYIGFKAYAPDTATSFKEDLAKTIADETMYYFENNDFAGIDENGRKYSIVWLPVAQYDGSAWTYYGVNSSTEKYIGWYYSVEWYNANGMLVASDCIRINLSNEGCHSSIEPYYMSDIKKEIDVIIDTKIAEVESVCEVIEF